MRISDWSSDVCSSDLIAPRAEIAAGAGYHHRLDIRGVDQAAKQVAQFGIRVERERVLALWTVQRNGRNLIVVGDAPKKIFRLIAGHAALVMRHGRSFLICALHLISPFYALHSAPKSEERRVGTECVWTC